MSELKDLKKELQLSEEEEISEELLKELEAMGPGKEEEEEEK